jgi:subtilisin family serine protease
MALRRIALMTAVLIATSLVSGLWGAPADNGVRVLLAVDRAQLDKVEQAIAAVNGVVHLRHKYVDVISATIPTESLPALFTNPGVLRVTKDVEVSLPDPVQMLREGIGGSVGLLEMSPDYIKELTLEEMQGLQLVRPATYYPYTNEQTRANQFYAATGHYGEGVVVAIIDAGVSSAASAVASRIVGAENFTGDGYPGDSPLNNFHGTAVACCVGANAIFGFSNPAIQNAVKRYMPSSVIPNYFGPGIDGIPMVGQAPLVKFYALKVFPRTGSSSPRSVIAAGVERAIELKEMYNAGQAGGVNIRVMNMSLGGMNLIAGNDPIYGPLMVRARDAGILAVVSAGNNGPNGLTIGTPGDSRNILTVGGTNDSPHYRITLDLFSGMGPGSGLIIHPRDYTGIASFSSRGPTADGRADPEIVAPAVSRFMQSATGGIVWAGGTSFSAPTVAGAAALLISAHAGATPDQIRAALIAGANKSLVSGKPTKLDQGYGFLDVMAAEQKFGAFNPLDVGLSTPSVGVNIQPYAIKIITADQYTGTTGWMTSLERKEFYFETTKQPLTGMTITVNVTAENPPAQQNQIWGDDAFVVVASAKTSATDARASAFVKGTQVFTLDAQDLELGITRVVILADWSNAGRIKASVSMSKNYDCGGLLPLTNGWVAAGETRLHPLVVPPGLTTLSVVTGWLRGWQAWPTSDIDVNLYDPAGNLIRVNNDGDADWDGVSLDCPERITVSNPAAGTWTVAVTGFTVWSAKEEYLVLSDVACAAKPAADPQPAELPATFALEQNYPNPFNPSTTIRYALPVDATVSLEVFNALGERVELLLNTTEAAGYKFVVFENSTLASGVYFYRITAVPVHGTQGAFVQTKKFVLTK